MFYRRKILLGLIQKAGGRIGSFRLQKLLFLALQGHQDPAYEFVPFKYGCFSFESYADLRALSKHNVVKEGEGEWALEDATDYFGSLKDEDRQCLAEVIERFRDFDDDALIRHTYLQFPFFAINSQVASKLLNREELRAVEAVRPTEEDMHLFTLGYEGLSIEGYLMRLIKANVKVLCDVRRNAMSMKYGFAKKTLESNCKNMGIEYIHIPALGIASGLRQELKTKQDYLDLFESYQQESLPKTRAEQSSLIGTLAAKGRIALTCFEADPAFCHRSRLADALTQTPGWIPQLTHL